MGDATMPASCATTVALDLGDGSLRVVVKECLDVAGFPTRCGSAALADEPEATEHAAVVQTMLERDCRVVGLANMHELAFGLSGLNPYLGTPTNPRWPDRIPGGSSSGSAVAVAEGACDFAVGTDAGGSIRLPACCCGVYGLKPTFGRIDRRGAVPRDSSLSCVGPTATSAEMITEAMQRMDPSFVPAPAPSRARIAVLVPADCDDAIRTALITALEEVDTDPLAGLPGFVEADEAARTILRREVWLAFGELAESDRPMGSQLRRRILAGRSIDARALAAAEGWRSRFRDEVDALLADHDAIALPTLPSVPPRLSTGRDAYGLISLSRLLRPFNLSGHPALSIPLQTERGFPAGLQLVGRHGEDAELCAIAESVARLLPRSGDE